MTDDIGKDLEALRPLPARLAELTSDLRKLATCGKPTCLERRALSMLEELGLEAAVALHTDYQTRAVNWVREAFGSQPVDCKQERAHRFLEEALEAVQAAGTTYPEALQLVDYVFSRPVGEVGQEVGGVLLTLAPFAAAYGVDMTAAGEAELARVNTPEIITKCRAKNASKPRNSPLPGTAPAEVAQ